MHWPTDAPSPSAPARTETARATLQPLPVAVLDMATAGVVRRVEAPDPIRLAALLATQGALLARSHLPSGQRSASAT